jgi:hypothetical protein
MLWGTESKHFIEASSRPIGLTGPLGGLWSNMLKEKAEKKL